MDVAFGSDGIGRLGSSQVRYAAHDAEDPPHTIDLVTDRGLLIVGIYGPAEDGLGIALALRLAQETSVPKASASSGGGLTPRHSPVARTRPGSWASD